MKTEGGNMSDNTLWATVWLLVTVLVICGFDGCQRFNEEDHRHREEMARLGYEKRPIVGHEGLTWQKAAKGETE